MISKLDYAKRQETVKDDIVYELLYAGALGSMLFDLLDPLRSWDFVRLPLFVLVLAFVFDYWLLHVNLHAFLKDKPHHRKYNASIIILFTISYFCLSHALTEEQRPTFAKTRMILGEHARWFMEVATPGDEARSVLGLMFLLVAITLVMRYNKDLPSKTKIEDALNLLPWMASFFGMIITCILYESNKPNPLMAAWWFNLTTGLLYIFYVCMLTSATKRYIEGSGQTSPSAGPQF